MDWKLPAALIGDTYAAQAAEARSSDDRLINTLLTHRKLPPHGWPEPVIELFLQQIALMDSNNFSNNIGVGEREARIVAPLVARRHTRLGHGIGRSGDVAAVQPKAAGSSLLVKLTHSMTLDLIHMCGVTRAEACIVLPVATGMSITLCLLTLRMKRPTSTFVLWPRIDQKTCLKAIITAGLVPVIIDGVLEGDEVRTNVAEIERKIAELGPQNILIVEIAELCKAQDVPHIVNNAYGLQATKCTHLINEAIRTGRVDAFVQSTDKNLMVPVGGAIVASVNVGFIEDVSKAYPGRASVEPVVDVFITLLTLGASGFADYLERRKENFLYLKTKLAEFAALHGERLLHTPQNPISIGVSLGTLQGRDKGVTYFGSMLFAKVVSPGADSVVAGRSFNSYGAHIDHYPTAYLTAAAAIGMKKSEVDTFIKRLTKAYVQFMKHTSSTNPAPALIHLAPDTGTPSEPTVEAKEKA